MKLLLENLFIALNAIWSSKLRSVLTALGIIIGILAVTLMGTLISGLDRSFEKSMTFLGKDVLFISKHEWFSDQPVQSENQAEDFSGRGTPENRS